MPVRIQLTVPLTFRRSGSAFDLHWSQLSQDETAMYDGVRVTTPARSIVDATASGTGPEQIEKAVRQALKRALLTPALLRAAAGRARYRNRRVVQPLIERAITNASL